MALLVPSTDQREQRENVRGSGEKIDRHERRRSCGRARRHRRRRRPRWAIRTLPIAWARVEGARVRSGQRDRQDVVLEPLSRRAMRCGKRGVFLRLRWRPAAGVAMAGALWHPAGDPALHQPCRGSVRSAAQRPAQCAGDLRRVRPRPQQMDNPDQAGRRGSRTVLHHGDGQPFYPSRAGVPRVGPVQGQLVSLRPVAA